MSYVVSHPDRNVEQATRLCDAVLVDIGGPDVDKVLSEHPYLAVTPIPGAMYAGTPEPVRSFGTTITLVSSSDVPEGLVYTVVKTVFENLSQLRLRFPGLKDLQPGEMFKSGLTAPLHPGAQRYFQEQGLF